MPPKKTLPIKPHSYSKGLEDVVIAYHRKHVAHSIKILYYFLSNCEEAGLSEESLHRAFEDFFKMPGFPLVYILKHITGERDRTEPLDLANIMKAF